VVPENDEPTAALTSRSAVAAALLLAVAVVIAGFLLLGDEGDGDLATMAPATAPTLEP
jgi:hypothetical protein